MGILDQLRNWTPEKDQGRTDFDDLPASVYRPRVTKDMIREVTGATDLRDAMPHRTGPNPPAGMVITDPAQQRRDTRPFADEVGQPSPAQRALIVKLVNELMTLNADRGTQAAEYTVKMTQHAAWEKGYGKNTSRWIDTLITAIKHERTTANTAPVVHADKPRFDTFDDVTDGRYAIVRDGKTHFYYVSRSEGRGQYEGRTFINVTEQAGDSRYPVKRWDFRKTVLDGIRAAGIETSHMLFADKLGECWHCGRALTDDTTNPYRKYGLGPVCGPKLGYSA